MNQDAVDVLNADIQSVVEPGGRCSWCGKEEYLMIVEALTAGPFGANCYVVGCEKTNAALVIDPGGDGDRILKRLEELGLNLELIVNTHGHFDHIGGNEYLKQKTGAKLYIHADDAEMLTEPEKNLSSLFDPGSLIISPPADIILHDGDRMEIGAHVFYVIHTPGHTKGSICLKMEDCLFAGDTLFADSIGRTDLPGGSYSEIMNSIKTKLCPLEDTLIIYPGHGPKSILGCEKRSNPYII